MTNSKPQRQGEQKKPLAPHEVRLIRGILEAEKNLRDLALFNTAIDTMLRASDLLQITVGDVVESDGVTIKTEFNLNQKKTSLPVAVTLTPICQDSLIKWIAESDKQGQPWRYLFTGFRKSSMQNPISTTQYRRLVKKWVVEARLEPSYYSTHSLRRTKASLIFQATGNHEIVRQLLGHSSIESTSHYLGVERKHALEVARRTAI